MRKALLLAVGAGLCLAGSSDAWPHGGGLDSYGCHHNRKLGGYHCHRGALRGYSFDSKADMIGRGKEGNGGARKDALPRKKETAPQH